MSFKNGRLMSYCKVCKDNVYFKAISPTITINNYDSKGFQCERCGLINTYKSYHN